MAAIEDDVATIGITDYAQSQLGDVVFVELPKVGRSLKKAEAAAVVELVKAASDVYAPISGEVLRGQRRTRRRACAGQFRCRRQGVVVQDQHRGQSELGGLMDEAAYKAHTPEQRRDDHHDRHPKHRQRTRHHLRRAATSAPRRATSAMLETVGARSLAELMSADPAVLDPAEGAARSRARR